MGRSTEKNWWPLQYYMQSMEKIKSSKQDSVKHSIQERLSEKDHIDISFRVVSAEDTQDMYGKPSINYKELLKKDDDNNYEQLSLKIKLSDSDTDEEYIPSCYIEGKKGIYFKMQIMHNAKEWFEARK